MRTSFNLDEKEIKQAIADYIRANKKIEVKNISIFHYAADSRDPREHSYFYATASE